ncbi:MAG: polysaccharide biosynthesis/export family protein [Oceanipulchritudo sp.]
MNFPQKNAFRALACVGALVYCALSGYAQEEQGSSSIPDFGAKASGSYVISPLDYLRIALFVADEQQFNTELRVSQNGTITVPHLGTIDVAGRTIEEMRELLYEPYNRDYYVNPHIDITVLGYAERSVTVIGKVNRQGLVPFPSEEGMTLLEAIAMAGGWSGDRLADKRNVTITRLGDDGEKFIIEVDARNLTTKDYPLKEGDLINVPERLW